MPCMGVSAKYRDRDLLTALAVLGGMALLLTGGGFLPDRIFHYGDWASYYIPLRMHLVEAWRGGDLLPLWWHGILGGFPVGANPQYGLFYPPHWLLPLLPLDFGLTLITWAHLFWGGLGMWRLLRGRGAKGVPALLGGIIYIGSGPVLCATSSVNLSLALAWLPWVLHWFPLGLKREGRWARRLAAVALAAMFLTGGLEILVWSVLIIPFWVWVSSRIYLGPRPGSGDIPRPQKRIRPVVLGIVVIGGAAAALAAVQILPGLELFFHSTRTHGIDPREASRFIAVAGRLSGSVLPRVSWNPETMTSWVSVTGDVRAHFLPSLYLGATALTLSVAGWRRAPRGDRAMMAWIVVLAVLFGLGSDLPVIGTLARLVPGSALFRYPEKYLLLVVLAVAYMSGWGLQALKERGGGRLLILAGLAGLVGAALMLAAGGTRTAFLLGWNGQQIASFGAAGLSVYQISQVAGLAATAGICLAGGLLLSSDRSRRIGTSTAAAVIVSLVLVELIAAGRGFLRTTPLSDLMAPGGAASSILEDGRGGRAARWILADDEAAPLGLFADPDRQLELYREWIVPNLAPLQGIPTFDGSSALRLMPQARAEATWRLTSESTRIPLGGALAIRYFLLTKPETATRVGSHHAARIIYPSGALPQEAAGTVPPLLVIENLAALQPIQVVYDWLVAADDEDAFERLRTSGLVPNQQVVLSPGPSTAGPGHPELPSPPPGGLPGTEPEYRITVMSRGDDVLKLKVSTPMPGLLVRSEYPYPGWRVRVNGRTERIHSANVVLQAVPLPAGTSEISFVFRPPLYIWGGIISLLGLIWFVAPLFRRDIH